MKTAILVFACNRPKNIDNLCINLIELEAQNLGDIFFFIDKPKLNQDAFNDVVLICEKASPLLKSKLFINSENIGLRDQIMGAIDWATRHYESFIVVEDDLYLAPSFIPFCIEMIERYRYNNEIVHINGWAPFEFRSNFHYTLPVMHCWGWAGWSSKWHQNLNSRKDIYSWLDSSLLNIKKLNFFGAINNYRQIQDNKTQKINTWAIFWYASIIKNRKVCVAPSKSLTTNNGFGSMATNTFSVIKQLSPAEKLNTFERRFKIPTTIIWFSMLRLRVTQLIKRLFL